MLNLIKLFDIILIIKEFRTIAIDVQITRHQKTNIIDINKDA